MTPDEIILTAVDLFQKQGYHATTVRQISTALGVTSAALYYHFPGKEAILESIFDMAMTTAEKHLDDLLASDYPAEVRLQKLVQEHAMAVIEDLPLMTVFFNEMKNLPAESRVRALARQRDYQMKMRSVISEAISAGYIDDVNPAIVVYAILGMCNWLHHWYKADGQLSPEQIGALFSRIISSGIARSTVTQSVCSV